MQPESLDHLGSRITIDPATRITPPSDDGRVLLHLETGSVCAINEIGSRVWSELNDGHSLEEIVELLAGEYRAPRERIEADVRAFITTLVSKRYLKTTGMAE